MDHRFTILGGGIAGLTAAIALKKIGIEADVFESAPEFKPVGAGLLLAANAVNAYKHLGLADKVISLGRLLPYFKVLDSHGKVISEADAGLVAEKYGLHNFAIHRARLHEALLSELDPARLHTRKRCTGFTRTDDTVELHFEDGSTHTTQYLIAADGIHSPVRHQLLPGTNPRYSGYTCWRAVVDAPHIPLNVTTETWGRGKRFGIVPLAEDKIYWFACINAPEKDPRMQAFRVDDLKRHFAGFHEPVDAILESTRDSDLLWNDIIDLKPIDRFAFDNIVLIGDAAHATTPNLGQGACQAIEDAVVLAAELKKNVDAPTAFQAFERRRLERAHFIVNTSWRIGKVAQWESPFLTLLRDNLFRIVPKSVNENQMRKVLTVDFE